MGKILVADDEAGIREALVRLLEAEGHDVIEAPDGKATLERVAAEHPDVLLLDNVMPKKDGMQVLEELRKHKATESLPVIMVTVKGAPKDRDGAVKFGVVDYINKPWMEGEIELRVKWALKGAGMVPAVPWDLSEEEGLESEAIRFGRGQEEAERDARLLGSALGTNVEVITRSEGGTVRTPDGVVRVDLPAGAVQETLALEAQRVEEEKPAIPASLRLKMGNTVADLTFTDRTGAPVEGVRLDKPAKITIKYTEEDLAKKSEKNLKIRRLNHKTGKWESMRSQVDTGTRTVSAREEQFSHPPDRGGAVVLIVENGEEEAGSLTRTLESSGYSVLIESQGDRTLERVSADRPDVVLLDLDLPRTDGFRVLRELKNDSRTRGTSVIMLGQDANQDNYAASMTLGARDLIGKPWHSGDLQQRVHRALQASRARFKQAERAMVRARARLLGPASRGAVTGKERAASGAGLRPAEKAAANAAVRVMGPGGKGTGTGKDRAAALRRRKGRPAAGRRRRKPNAA